MPNPAASPTVSSTVGLKNMVIAELTTDTEETLTYGDLQLVAGAIEASIEPQNADPDVQFADDIEFDVLYPHKFRYVWLFKVRAKPVTENYSTKEGTKVTRQTGEIEWTAIKRTHDGQYQAVADEGENGFTAEKAATFLQSVYAPTFTPEP